MVGGGLTSKGAGLVRGCRGCRGSAASGSGCAETSCKARRAGVASVVPVGTPVAQPPTRLGGPEEAQEQREKGLERGQELRVQAGQGAGSGAELEGEHKGQQ